MVHNDPKFRVSWPVYETAWRLLGRFRAEGHPDPHGAVATTLAVPRATAKAILFAKPQQIVGSINDIDQRKQ